MSNIRRVKLRGITRDAKHRIRDFGEMWRIGEDTIGRVWMESEKKGIIFRYPEDEYRIIKEYDG